jgi:addiction module RelE/StbE family toxin
MPKKKYEIHYLSVAEQDITEIIEYISADNPDAADRLIDKIDGYVSRLKDLPELGTIPKDDRLRKLGYRTLLIDNYLVFYVIRDEEIEIRRILYGKRKYEFLL